MCSLFTIERSDLTRLFGVQKAASVRDGEQRPGMAVPVVRRHPDTGERALDPLAWGLIPRWARNPDMGRRLFNARLETARDKPSFREAFAKRRCLIPANSWAEWQATGDGRKRRWTLEMRDGQPFAFAGLWEGWKQPDGEWRRTCTVLTTQAREDLAAIHHRMPVPLLGEEAWSVWLTPGKGTETLLDLAHAQAAAAPIGATAAN